MSTIHLRNKIFCKGFIFEKIAEKKTLKAYGHYTACLTYYFVVTVVMR